MYYAIITEQSRKAKSTRNLYDYLKSHYKQEQQLPQAEDVEGYIGQEGVRIAPQDRYRVLNLKLHDEHLSPYFKSDMSLFHLLMIDEQAEIRMYKLEGGWMFLLDGVQEAPKPFGNQGFDMR
ncbi:MAG: hypothetical protein JWN30_641 [Bacilli bacterium]|nr:hypothetical protein [Bacilli bacterium]